MTDEKNNISELIDIENIVPAIYHYLDGNISKNYGFDIKKIVNILQENNIINTYIKKRNVNFLCGFAPFNHIYVDDINDNTNLERECTDFLLEISKKINDKNDLIILLSTTEHALSLYISKNDINKYNVAFINSGDGIEKHKYTYNNDKSTGCISPNLSKLLKLSFIKFIFFKEL